MRHELFTPVTILVVIFLIEGILPHIRGRRKRLAHAVPNVIISLVNAALTVLFFTQVTQNVMVWAQKNTFGFFNAVSMQTAYSAAAAFILFDFWMYLWHQANHRVPFLWRFHRAHHTDAAMDATTALRFHPVEIIISSVLNLAVIVLLGLSAAQLALYKLVFQPVIIFHHSNVGLPEAIDRTLRSVIVTPNMHRVHHSRPKYDTNSNYGSVFSFWDRLFKSFRKHVDTKRIVFGIEELEGEKLSTVKGILATPFIP